MDQSLPAMELIFEWDEDKEAKNIKKHKINFREAKTVFNDPLAITVFDTHHSDDEDRFADIGRSEQGHLLVVSYTERGLRIRIISCRAAEPMERKHYERQNYGSRTN